MPRLMGIFVSGTYAKMLGIYAHITSWLCELYLEYGSYIYPVVYVKFYSKFNFIYI